MATNTDLQIPLVRIHIPENDIEARDAKDGEINGHIITIVQPGCSICQSEPGPDITTPCNHVFHKGCLSTWLALHDNCPLCRRPNIKRILRSQLGGGQGPAAPSERSTCCSRSCNEHIMTATCLAVIVLWVVALSIKDAIVS